VALKGTVGKPAIDGTMSGLHESEYFDTTCPEVAAACVQEHEPGGNKPEIAFNQRYRYEDFRLLASTAPTLY
jgi:hypothetical protein